MPSAQRRDATEAPGVYSRELGREHLEPGVVGTGPGGRRPGHLDRVDTLGAERPVLPGWQSDRVREPAIWHAGNLGCRPRWTTCPAADLFQWQAGRNAGVVARRTFDRRRLAERERARRRLPDSRTRRRGSPHY